MQSGEITDEICWFCWSIRDSSVFFIPKRQLGTHDNIIYIVEKQHRKNFSVLQR